MGDGAREVLYVGQGRDGRQEKGGRNELRVTCVEKKEWWGEVARDVLRTYVCTFIHGFAAHSPYCK